MDEGQERIERRGLFLHLGEGLGRPAHFRDFGVGQRLHGAHALGRADGRLHRSVQQQRRVVVRNPVYPGPHPGAEQAVAAAQMVVEEGERRADREGVQPERDLGELHRHRVLVHAVDAALEHHAAHDMAVVEPRRIDRPALRRRIGEDRFGESPRSGRRAAIHGRPARRSASAIAVDGAVGQPVHEVDEEMPGAHRRVADPEFEDFLRRVEAGEFRRSRALRRRVAERLAAGLDKRADRFVYDQTHKVVRRVVAAPVLAHERVGAHADFALLAHQFPLHQPLVNRAELLHAEFAVVDVAPAVRPAPEGERIDDVGHEGIGEPHPPQQRRARGVEQASIVGGQTDISVAAVDGPAEVVYGVPVMRGPR